jgi:kinetochor protein Mis14/NSL1
MASPSSHAHLRKIELQSPLDLAHLEAQARKAARSRIDAALPPTERTAAGEDDIVRRRVEELVDAYIKRTFEGVRRNVCVNGMDFDEGEDGKGGRDLEEGKRPPSFVLCV